MNPRELVLASSSPYRRAQLETLGLAFEWDAPEIDETPERDETPEQLVERLSGAKATTVAERWPDAVVIAGDQCAILDGNALGKPGTTERAREQLALASGRQVRFLSGLAVVSATHTEYAAVPVDVHFRALTTAEIDRYVERDQPLDCAGAIRSEGLGAALMERMVTEDPSAMLGLPRIALARMLRAHGFQLP